MGRLSSLQGLMRNSTTRNDESSLLSVGSANSYGAVGLVKPITGESIELKRSSQRRHSRSRNSTRLLLAGGGVLIGLTFLVASLYLYIEMTSLSNISFHSQAPYTHAPPTAFYPSLSRQYIFSSDLANQNVWDQTLTQSQQELVDRFTPIIKLHSEEEFYPSDIDYMLGHYSRVTTKEGEEVTSALNSSRVQFPLDRSNLPWLPNGGRWLWLDLPDPHDAQPDFPTEESSYLYGPGGGTARDRRSRNAMIARPGGGIAHRKIIREPLYTFYVDKGDGIVDLYYWTFYPYNLGKKIRFTGIVGNHLGDWEQVRVRTINGTGHSVDYSVHRDLKAGTWRWEDVEKHNGRPVAYSARGSHGLWPTAGPQVYHTALFGLFKLIDYTDDRGTLWDPIAEAVTWARIPQNLWGHPRYDMNGKSAWLNFGGRWGQAGNTDCWYYKLSHTCGMADSPGGPNRWFVGPPKCIISPLRPATSRRSLVTVTLDESALAFAHNQNLTRVRAEAVCSDSSGWEEAPRIDEGVSLLSPGMGDVTEIVNILLLAGMNRTTFELEFEACPTAGWHRTYITGYKLSLCDDQECLWVSPARDVCTFLPSGTTRGYTSGQSIELVDLDPWSWWYDGSRVRSKAEMEDDRKRKAREGGWEWFRVVFVYLSAYFEVFWR